jgi:hypothetical protein
MTKECAFQMKLESGSMKLTCSRWNPYPENAIRKFNETLNDNRWQYLTLALLARSEKKTDERTRPKKKNMTLFTGVRELLISLINYTHL